MDRVTMLTYPDRTYVTYHYNPRGLLESVPGVISRYDYNEAGQNETLELVCGTVTTYYYDHRHRLERIHTVRSHDLQPLTLQDLNYEYDPVSNIIAIVDGRTEIDLTEIGQELGIESAEEARKFDATQTFQYDPLYRLTQASNASVYGTVNYRYDRIGNMVARNAQLDEPDPLMDLGEIVSGGSVVGSGNTAAWNRQGRASGDPPGPHAVSGTAQGPKEAMTFTYDDNGNMLTCQDIVLEWDSKDRLAGMTTDDATAQYLYDYAGNRRRRLYRTNPEGPLQTVLYIDKASEVRNDMLIKYVHAGPNRIASSRSSAPSQEAHFTPSEFTLSDHLGSVQFLLDAQTGAATAQMAYFPFGRARLEKMQDPARSQPDYAFSGKEEDSESQLYYFEARYYSPLLCRFSSVDPARAELSSYEKSVLNGVLRKPARLNPYSYVLNNPLAYTDPSGQEETKQQRSLTEKEFKTFEGMMDKARLLSLIPFVGPALASEQTQKAVFYLAEIGAISKKEYANLARKETLSSMLDTVMEGTGVVGKALGRIGKALKISNLEKKYKNAKRAYKMGEIASGREERKSIDFGDFTFKRVEKLSQAEASKRKANNSFRKAIDGIWTKGYGFDRSNYMSRNFVENRVFGH